jgi:hypothetical protein
LENGVEMLGKEAIVDSGIIIIISYDPGKKLRPRKYSSEKLMTPEKSPEKQ